MSSTNRGAERHPDDFYETPSWATQAILPHLRELPDGSVSKPLYMVLEPACGRGAIARELRAAGVDAGHLMLMDLDLDRCLAAAAEFGHVNQHDFLQYAAHIWEHRAERFGLIIGNPPYSLAREFVDAALSICEPDGEVAMLLRLNFLGSQKRAAWHRAKPCDVYILPRRPSFTPDGKTDSCEYAWFVWGPERGGHWSILEADKESK